MGCDIHAMIEKRNKWFNKTKGKYEDGFYWVNAGDPQIDRDYEMFSVLGNVRNEDDIPYIAKDRGVPGYDLENGEDYSPDCCTEYFSWYRSWKEDSHSASWVTLKEMKEYDTNQKYHNSNFVVERNAHGEVTETIKWSSDPEQMKEPVGETTVFGTFGDKSWKKLIAKMEAVKTEEQTDEEVRLLFFFDS